MIDSRPQVPYYAVIFTSVRTEVDDKYVDVNDQLVSLAKDLPGFIGEESARNEFGVSVSYWKDLDSIAEWKKNASHIFAQEKGKSDWYERYRVRVCLVERDYEFFKGKGYV
jgi:heme-degrading monooxygenase HmoA